MCSTSTARRLDGSRLTIVALPAIVELQRLAEMGATVEGCMAGDVWVKPPLGTRSTVSVIKSLWASVQGDPVFMRRVNGWFTIFWIAMIPVSVAFGLLSSVVYVSALSVWALVSGHWSAWQAARVEVAQQAQAEELENHPVEERVVDHLVEKTEINRAAHSSSANGVQVAPGGDWAELIARLDRIETVLQASAR